jgi:hypothetical protein
LGKAYIINPRDEYLASLDIDEALLRIRIVMPKVCHQFLEGLANLSLGGPLSFLGVLDIPS